MKNLKNEKSLIIVAHNETDELLTIDEIAAKLKVKKSFLYAPCRRKGHDAIPFVKVGKYLRYRFAEVTEWINESQARS